MQHARFPSRVPFIFNKEKIKTVHVGRFSPVNRFFLSFLRPLLRLKHMAPPVSLALLTSSGADLALFVGVELVVKGAEADA